MTQTTTTKKQGSESTYPHAFVSFYTGDESIWRWCTYLAHIRQHCMHTAILVEQMFSLVTLLCIRRKSNLFMMHA